MTTINTNKCSVCSQEFPSRNQLFKHLKNSAQCTPAPGPSGGADETLAKEAGVVGGGDGNNSNTGPRLSKGNDAYYEYYLRQKICNGSDDDDDEAKNEEDWKEVYHKLRTPLPVSYRIHESSPISEFSAQLLSLIEKSQEDSTNATHEKSGSDKVVVGEPSKEKAPPVDNNTKQNNKLQQWSFNNNASENEKDDSIPKLRMTITPQFHRKNKSSSRSSASKADQEDDIYSPILHALQELGAVHRQELVSAIPPLVLWATGSKAKEEDSNDAAAIVADLCAAPGSKSLQLLDMLYASAKNNGKNAIPSGLLVVNDSDRNRIITLCQRSRHVPRAPMLAINIDARYFPGIRRRCNARTSDRAGDNESAVAMSVREKAGYKQKYDKVLADVPCSGDGTVRKNKQVWNTWSIPHAMSLHRLQRKILRRGMELLRPGGIVVYSTCSLNPLEDEAVVASVIGDVGGLSAMEIVPLPEWLVQKCGALKGLTTWQVPHPKFGKKGITDMYQDFDGVPNEHQGGIEKGKKGGQINGSMFPPQKETELSRQLRHCGRFVPNDGLDSGGFFVACIRRLQVGELGAKEKVSKSASDAPKEAIAEEEKASAAPVANDGIGKLGKGGDPKPSATSISGTSDFPAMKDVLEGEKAPIAENDGGNLDKVEDQKPSSTSAPDSTDPSDTKKQCLREGDWICTLCKEINFGRRGGSRCFGCKARKPRSMEKDKEQKVQKPLLMQPQQSSVLESFFDFFGIPTGPESTLPMQNIRIIRRVKETVIVVVSDALSKLAISDSWSPVREVGITLATFPNAIDKEQVTQNHEFRLFDEGLPILTTHATRRHFKMQPMQFRNVLAQSVRHLLESESSPAAEVERVKATLDRSFVVESLCEKDMWYESLPDSMASMWESCKAAPGFFIASCECEIPNSEGSAGHFSFCGFVHAQGTVEVKTTLRVAGAMLVILNKFSEVVSSSSSDPPMSKRMRI